MGSTSFLLTVGYLVTCSINKREGRIGRSIVIKDNKGPISDAVDIGYCDNLVIRTK